MESNASIRAHDKENPSPATSPGRSNGSSSTTAAAVTPPHTPKPPTPRSHEPNSCPTTFVQADTTTFKRVVQMLTGSSNADPAPPAAAARGGGIPPIKSTGQKRQGFKLYERRNSLKNGLMIDTLSSGFSQNSKHEILSPSILDFPALVLSPATPLNEDTPTRSTAAEEEEKAIAEKKFYFHPSPRTPAARDAEPQLLPLFPVTSPRVSGSSS